MNAIPGLEPRHQAILEALLAPLGPDYSITLFGSRAKGTWRRHSDIDLLVVGERPVPLLMLARIETEIAESDLPVKVDLVDARRASVSFLKGLSAPKG
jgi:predicted nucleotidyltransferase